MPVKTARYQCQTNFLLTIEQRRRLACLVEVSETGVGPVLRRLIDAAYKHTVEQVPHCSSCDPCRCPQFFAPPRPPMSAQPDQPAGN